MKARLLITLLFFSSLQLKAQNTSENNTSTPDSTASEITKSDTTRSQVQIVGDTLKNNLSEVIPDSTILKKAESTAINALKDSIDNKIDLPQIAIDSTTAKKAVSALKQVGKDSLNRYVEIPDITIDSTTTNQIKSEAKSRAKSALEDEIGEEIPMITIDSTTTEQVKKEAVNRGEQALKGTDEFKVLEGGDSELGQLKDYKDKLEQTQEEIKQAAAKKELKQKMASHAKEYITEHADKIQQVQSQMGELKQKYSSMPNSNDLSTAVKRSSLKGESFWKRLVIGGNFNISKTNPLNIDLSPVVGYKINKLFEVGITGAYRSQFKANSNGVNASGEKEVYGYSAFANHMAFKNFFGYLEAENMRTTNIRSEESARQWNQTLLIGVGRKFNVTKWLEMQTMILFNVLHDNKDGLYNSPVVFKTGLRAKK